MHFFQKLVNSTIRLRLSVASVVFVAMCGCFKTDGENHGNTPSPTDRNKVQDSDSPQFAAMVVQLHPDGTYWRHVLARAGEGSELDAVDVEAQFAVPAASSLKLAVTFVGHVDGKDKYQVSRSLPSDDPNADDEIMVPVYFDGAPMVAQKDRYGITIFLDPWEPL